MKPGDPEKLEVEARALASQRRWSELVERLEDLDESALASHPKLALALAEALVHLGRTEGALGLATAAEDEFRKRHDRVNLLHALNLAGAVQFELGDLAAAQDRFSALLELAREDGDDEMSGRATNNMGTIANLRGDHQRALSLFNLSVPAYQRVGHAAGLAQISHNVAIVYRDLGYWAEAEKHYRQAANRARQVADERLEAMAVVGRAELFHRRGDQVYAEAEATRALESFDSVGDALGRADALRLLGAIALAKGDTDLARSRVESALAAAEEHANPLLEAEIHEERARLNASLGQAALARADLEVAAAIYQRLGARERRASVESKLREIQK